jgi:hypothetical protein
MACRALAMRRHEACAAAKSLQLFTSVQKVYGYTIPSINACRNMNGTRHAFAIHEGCGSGNPVLRRGGNHAVRVLGRNATAGGGWEVLRRFPVHRRGGKTAVFLRRGLSISPLRFPRSPRHRKWPRANTLYTCGECSHPYPVCGDERERCDGGHGVTAHGQGPPSALRAWGGGR